MLIYYLIWNNVVSICRLRQLDLEVLRRLHRKVNVVPVIAKADTLTTSEVKKLKERILADIEEHEIQVYLTFIITSGLFYSKILFHF